MNKFKIILFSLISQNFIYANYQHSYIDFLGYYGWNITDYISTGFVGGGSFYEGPENRNKHIILDILGGGYTVLSFDDSMISSLWMQLNYGYNKSFRHINLVVLFGFGFSDIPCKIGFSFSNKYFQNDPIIKRPSFNLIFGVYAEGRSKHTMYGILGYTSICGTREINKQKYRDVLQKKYDNIIQNIDPNAKNTLGEFKHSILLDNFYCIFKESSGNVNKAIRDSGENSIFSIFIDYEKYQSSLLYILGQQVGASDAKFLESYISLYKSEEDIQPTEVVNQDIPQDTAIETNDSQILSKILIRFLKITPEDFNYRNYLNHIKESLNEGGFSEEEKEKLQEKIRDIEESSNQSNEAELFAIWKDIVSEWGCLLDKKLEQLYRLQINSNEDVPFLRYAWSEWCYYYRKFRKQISKIFKNHS